MKPFKSLAIATALLLASCASTKQVSRTQVPSKTDPTKSVVYVLRPSQFARAVTMPVLYNNTRIGETGPRGYLSFEVDPGEQRITSVAENKHDMTLNVEPGKTYYLKQQLRMGWFYSRTKLVEIDAKKGEKLAKKLTKPVLIAKN